MCGFCSLAGRRVRRDGLEPMASRRSRDHAEAAPDCRASHWYDYSPTYTCNDAQVTLSHALRRERPRRGMWDLRWLALSTAHSVDAYELPCCNFEIYHRIVAFAHRRHHASGTVRRLCRRGMPERTTLTAANPCPRERPKITTCGTLYVFLEALQAQCRREVQCLSRCMLQLLPVLQHT